jgi:PIN domain nuclease of toxin-antitoxin system
VRSVPQGRIVADASFLISVAEGDALALRFVGLLNRCEVTAVNFGETSYKIEQRAGVRSALTESTFTALGVTIAAVDVAHGRCFAKLKLIDSKSRRDQSGDPAIHSLSLVDMVCLAHALVNDLPVITGDRHWTTLRSHGLDLDIFDYHDPELAI